MSRTVEISKSFTFEAAHYFAHMPQGHGYARMHGHSYLVEVGLTGTPDAASGWVTDFSAVARALDQVKAQLDHNTLNEVDGLDVPSLENIARWIADQLMPAFPTLSRVVVMRPSCGERCTLVL